MPLKRKIQAVYEVAGTAFGEELQIDWTGEGWQALESAIQIRNRITHPKSFQDCSVLVIDIDTVMRAEDWFRAANNEFARIAREHRDKSGWWLQPLAKRAPG